MIYGIDPRDVLAWLLVVLILLWLIGGFLKAWHDVTVRRRHYREYMERKADRERIRSALFPDRPTKHKEGDPMR